MKSKFITWVMLAFALAWLPANSYAYYVFIRSDWAPLMPTTVGELREAAHMMFLHGVRTPYPRGFTDNIALDLYNDMIHSNRMPLYFYLMYLTIPDAERYTRTLGPLNGLLLDVSPDARAFNFRETLRQMRNVVPNQSFDRARILRFINGEINHVPASVLVTALPLPTDLNPVNPIIHEKNIERVIVYFNDRIVDIVDRNPNDPPFSEGGGAHVEEGYSFNPSPEMFPVEGTIVSVAPGTDNVTFVGACGPARTAQTARFDSLASSAQTCNSEDITLQEFNKKHLRHQGGTIPSLLLLQ